MKRIVILILGSVAFALATSALYFLTDVFATAPVGEPPPQRPILPNNPTTRLQVQFLRHGTLLLGYDNARLLIDPMLATAGSLPPIPLTSSRVKNPLVPLPCTESELLAAFDAVLVTHLHPDHFDEEAEKRIPKDTPIFCQPADEKGFAAMGFRRVQAVNDSLDWHGLRITRYEVHHAVEPWLRNLMGQSSAYTIHNATTGLMLTGDAVLDDALRTLISRLSPAHLVANAGGAQMLFGSPITLTPKSLLAIVQLSPATHVHAIHMDAINHCKSHKSELLALVRQNGLEQSISIPQEGDRWELP